MSIIITRSKEGRINGIMSIPNFYRYKGFTFEVHGYMGPIKVNKNFEPSKRQGDKFYKVFDEWNRLSSRKKEKTKINP